MGQARGAGRYYVGPLPAGDYRVEVRDSVNPRAEVQGSGADGSVTVRSGEVTKVEIEYGGDTGKISGRVVDDRGAPIVNAWVSAASSDFETDPYARVLVPRLAQMHEQRSLTDAEGTFEIDRLAEDAEFSITASHTDGRRAKVEHVRVGESVQIKLAASASLAGVVVGAAGRPAGFFRIALINTDTQQQQHSEFGPDALGKWSIDHVNAGAVQIHAQGEDGIATASQQLAPGQHVQGLSLTLESPATAQN